MSTIQSREVFAIERYSCSILFSMGPFVIFIEVSVIRGVNDSLCSTIIAVCCDA